MIHKTINSAQSFPYLLSYFLCSGARDVRRRVSFGLRKLTQPSLQAIEIMEGKLIIGHGVFGDLKVN